VVLKERTNLRQSPSDQLYGPGDLWQSGVADCRSYSGPGTLPEKVCWLRSRPRRCAGQNPVRGGQARVGKGRRGCVNPVAHADALEAVINSRRAQDWAGCRAGGLTDHWSRLATNDTCSGSGLDRKEFSKYSIQQSIDSLGEGTLK